MCTMYNVKYTYDNWLDGEVRLSSSNSSNLIVEESIELDIEIFTVSDQDRIRQTQLDIFEEDANSLFLGWKETAVKSIENSRAPERYVEAQIRQCLDLLEAPLTNAQNIKLHIWKMKLDRGFVGEIQNYYSRVVLEGAKQDYSYISSLNDPYIHEEQDPFSYSEAICRYCSWLNSLSKDAELKTIERWHPEVFKNNDCYTLFIDFIELVSTPELKWPDVCFIFHQMYAKYYIVEQQTQKSFIKFVNQKLNTDFDKEEIPKRSQEKNLFLYKKLLKKFQL